jgi:drug/metabolite transporter (DMT)-like permease
MIIILYALFIILEFNLMITAMKYTPNIGYTRTLMNLNIIITLFISYFIFKEKINKECFFGILLCIIGVSIIAQYYKKE